MRMCITRRSGDHGLFSVFYIPDSVIAKFVKKDILKNCSSNIDEVDRHTLKGLRVKYPNGSTERIGSASQQTAGVNTCHFLHETGGGNFTYFLVDQTTLESVLRKCTGKGPSFTGILGMRDTHVLYSFGYID
ncbi:hypothetical protein T484DRAFT_1756962 [Baffinella frigidus]|nr:hypothetical protein T484DRAFT_1756962 [Cryptophyta sp. CCMP2293]